MSFVNKTKENPTEFCILHTNDIHSYLDNVIKHTALIKNIRKENRSNNMKTFLFNSGDMISGTIYYTMYEGTMEAKLLNEAKYDVVTLGNHEFDKGSLKLEKFLALLNADIVSSNVDISKDPILQRIKISKSLIKKVNDNLSIGIVGLTCLETLSIAFPSKDTIFFEYKEILKKEIDNLKKQGVNLIILLSHLGVNEDLLVAQEFHDIDIILGGHTHTVLEEPIIVKNEHKKIYIMQTGQNCQYLGEIKIEYTNHIEKLQYTLHNVEEYKEVDKGSEDLLSEAKLKIKEMNARAIGISKTFLNGTREDLQKGETNLGNLIADAFYYKAQEEYNPDFAIFNSRGIRSMLDAGSIYYTDIALLLPFGTTLYILEITGKQLKEVFTNGIAIQVSHLKLELSEQDKTVEKCQYVKNGEYISIEDNKKYILVTNSFLGTGKGGFETLSHAKVIAKDVANDVDLVAEYISKIKGEFEYKEEGRIIWI